MSLDKEYLRSKVIQGINLMPSDGLVVRELINNYDEKEGYGKVADLRGVLYNTSNAKSDTILLKDIGEIPNKVTKCYLVDFNEKSNMVKLNDYIFISGKGYKVVDLGEEFEVYFEFKLEEHHLKLVDNTIADDGEYYYINEVPTELWSQI